MTIGQKESPIGTDPQSVLKRLEAAYDYPRSQSDCESLVPQFPYPKKVILLGFFVFKPQVPKKVY